MPETTQKRKPVYKISSMLNNDTLLLTDSQSEVADFIKKVPYQCRVEAWEPAIGEEEDGTQTKILIHRVPPPPPSA